ncbi:DUF6879 family protein [Nocardia brasiliensis]|uniref:DUF6879 family protein n=1 Tax=Nocardia brasiliensis TaxID=37326 RepID=UPI002457F138|nr:DUF6879 family protein [Nocardia brasiliensis]
MNILQADEFLALFEQCEESAFHIEVRDAYAVPDESEPFRLFLCDEEDDYEWFQDWLAVVKALGQRGATMTRVRVVTEPHSDYHRWHLKTTRLNVEAGEDIRYLSCQMVDSATVLLTTGGYSTIGRSCSIWSIMKGGPQAVLQPQIHR